MGFGPAAGRKMNLLSPAETYVSKLQVQDKHVYVKLTWKQNEDNLFHIQVFDDYSWSGRFSNNFALKFRERDNVDEDEHTYAINVKKALIGEDDNYDYEFTTDLDDSNTASFSWKKKFKGVNVLYGKVPVHRDVDPEPRTVLVDLLLKKNSDLKNDIKLLHSNTNKLVSELDKSRNELEKYINIKTSLETTLYGRFVQLLNAKKRRIQLLEDNLLNFEEPTNISMSSELD